MSFIRANVSGVNELLKTLNGYTERKLQIRTEKILERLAEIGKIKAYNVYKDAVYAGTNDVTVTYNKTQDGYEISADGASVLFIEFGTGVSFPEISEEKPAGIVGHGEYGKGHGKYKGWTYPLKNGLGNAGKVITDKNGNPKGLAFTRGNPPARAMYQAREEMIRRIKDVVQEVLNND